MFNSLQLWTIACQAPLSVEFLRQEFWSGLPFPTPGYLPDAGIKPVSLASPSLAGWLLYHCTTWEAPTPLESASNADPSYVTQGQGLARKVHIW